jgi:hypothetical protein
MSIKLSEAEAFAKAERLRNEISPGVDPNVHSGRSIGGRPLLIVGKSSKEARECLHNRSRCDITTGY